MALFVDAFHIPPSEYWGLEPEAIAALNRRLERRQRG